MRDIEMCTDFKILIIKVPIILVATQGWTLLYMLCSTQFRNAPFNLGHLPELHLKLLLLIFQL